MAHMTGVFRLGQDAAVRSTVTGATVMDLSLVFNYGKKDGAQQPFQWINATMWGDRANKVAEYLVKGSVIYAVLSEPHIEYYPKKDGTQGVKMVARLEQFEFVGGRQERQEQQVAPAQEDQSQDEDLPF